MKKQLDGWMDRKEKDIKMLNGWIDRKIGLMVGWMDKTNKQMVGRKTKI